MDNFPEQEKDQSFAPPEPSPDTFTAPVAAVPLSPPADERIPEDLRVPWDWLDVVLFLFFGLGSIVVLAQVLTFIFAGVFALKPQQIKDAATLNTAFAVTHQVLWSLAMLIFLWLQMALRFRAPFWHTLRFRRFQAGERTFAGTLFTFFGLGMALAVAVQLASAFLRTPSKLPIEGMFQTRPSILMMMAAGILVAPLAEELMFRGFLYPVVARKFGVAAGIAVVGSLFGLMHAPQLWGGWGQIALLMLVGMVLTYARARTGSVLASYVLHLGYNSLLLLGFFLATGGLKNLPPPR